MKSEGLEGVPGETSRGKNGEKLSVFSAGPAMGWGELWGDGRKWGRAEAGWVTWAFVGRWWEAPPWPLAWNAKQRCHCLTSVAADACAACFSGNQEQTQTAPPALHTYTPHHHVSLNPCASQDSTKARANILQEKIPIQQEQWPDGERNILPHSWPQRSRERVLGQTSGDTQGGCFHIDIEN